MLKNVSEMIQLVGTIFFLRKKEGEDSAWWHASLDFLKRAYLAKRGKGSLVSKDKTVEIRPAGGIYDGVDLSVAKF